MSTKKVQEVSIISWNARSLLHSKAGLRRKKLAYLQKIAHSTQLLCLQETHGTQAEIEAFFERHFPRHLAFVAAGRVRGAGGNVVLIDKEVGGERSGYTHQIFAGGRAHRVAAEGEGCFSAIWNIHNYDIPLTEVNHITRKIIEDRNRSLAAPDCASTWVVGDWNFRAAGEETNSFAAPTTAVRNAPIAAPTASHAAAWNKALDLLIDFYNPLPTHFVAASNAATRIDRVYAALPPWGLPSSASSAGPMGDPRDLDDRGLSDHAPVRVAIGSRQRHASSLQPIHKDIIALPRYRALHDILSPVCEDRAQSWLRAAGGPQNGYEGSSKARQRRSDGGDHRQHSRGRNGVEIACARNMARRHSYCPAPHQHLRLRRRPRHSQRRKDRAVEPSSFRRYG